MPKAIIHITLILLLLLNGMGYTLIQVHFLLDREQITALYCINKDQPELQCDGKCELGKRLAESKSHQENGVEISLEELSLTYTALQITYPISSSHPQIPAVQASPYHPAPTQEILSDFFHPPQC
ncbi:hypothetical protein [Algoriphagus namhaensis]